MRKIGGKISFSREEPPDNPHEKESNCVRLFLTKFFDAKKHPAFKINIPPQHPLDSLEW
jgi:hypothetical protein